MTDNLGAIHESRIVDYVREVFNLPGLPERVLKTFRARMKTTEIDDPATINSVLHREVTQAGFDCLRRAGLLAEFAARGRAAR